MAGPRWEKATIEIVLPDIITKTFETFDRTAGQLSRTLEFLQTGLTAIKFFLIDGVNPLLLALEYVLQQILNVIQNIQVSGVYMLGLYPSQATNTNFVKFSEVTAGFDPLGLDGFYTLNTTDALQKVAESFDDVGDPNRPSTDDGSVAGACVIFAGTGAADSLGQGGGLGISVKTFQTIIDLFQEVFHLEHFKKYKILLDKMGDDLARARVQGGSGNTITIPTLSGSPEFTVNDRLTQSISGETDKTGVILRIIDGVLYLTNVQGVFNTKDFVIAEPSGASGTPTKVVADKELILTVKRPKSKTPDWNTKRVTIDLIPALGDVLNEVESQVQGFKDMIDTGAATSMESLIKYIGIKIQEIEDIQTKITKVQKDMKKLADLLASLRNFNFHILFVPSQVGGVNILKKALIDTNLEDRPPSNLQFCAVAAFVGSGTGFGLLANLLGFSSGNQLGIEDNVEFEDNVMKAYHSIQDIGPG